MSSTSSRGSSGEGGVNVRDRAIENKSKPQDRGLELNGSLVDPESEHFRVPWVDDATVFADVGRKHPPPRPGRFLRFGFHDENLSRKLSGCSAQTSQIHVESTAVCSRQVRGWQVKPAPPTTRPTKRCRVPWAFLKLKVLFFAVSPNGKLPPRRLCRILLPNRTHF